MSIPLLILHTVLITELSCEIGQTDSSLSMLFQNGFSSSSSFIFPCKFQNNLIYIHKSLGEIWVGIVLNLCINVGKIDIVTLLSLPIHRKSIYLDLFRLLSLVFVVFSKQVLYMFCYIFKHMYFHFPRSDYKQYCVFNLFSHVLFSIKRCDWYLCVGFLSCYLAELSYFVLVVVLQIPWDLQIQAVLFFSFQHLCLFFLLSYSTSQNFQHILASFPILGGSIHSFTIKYVNSRFFCRCFLSSSGGSPLFLFF